MNKENCALKLVDEIILYYDARSKKLQITATCFGSHRIHHQGVITCTGLKFQMMVHMVHVVQVVQVQVIIP